MTAEKCGCDRNEKGSCAACLMEQDLLGYWCQTCKREVSEKRCPYCGLKAQKKRGADRVPGQSRD